MSHLQRLPRHGRRPVRVALLLAALAGGLCIGAAVTKLVAVSHAQAKGAGRTPAAWELLVQDRYENKGVAKVERLGERWVLSISCRGTHTTYLDDTTLDLTKYHDRFVAVRYDYIDRSLPDPKCFRAPCGPVTERRISLERITLLSITPEEARERERLCE